MLIFADSAFAGQWRRRLISRMSEVSKSVLVNHAAEQMFSLVDAVEDYPQFMPWCSGASVDYRDEVRTRATIHINFRGIRQSFTTENLKEWPTQMRITLVKGPFRTLDGTWRFIPLSAGACKIEFKLHYEFSSRILEKLIGPVFHYIAGTFVDAFLRRARSIYGCGEKRQN
jgi:ribosome-associated toxin RatA of RatAB toxin-antitoxin module